MSATASDEREKPTETDPVVPEAKKVKLDEPDKVQCQFFVQRFAPSSKIIIITILI
jgi:hypothetical protein